MSFDVAAVRSHFPALAQGAAHFDGPGGSQTPDVVADAMRATLLAPMANRGSITVAEQNADGVVLAARSAMADLLNVEPAGVVFGRSMTQLTFDLARTLADGWGDGDEIVVSRLDHDANVRPWVIAAGRAGATVRWIDFDPVTAELTPADVAAVLGPRTRLVAITGASNLLGTRPDLVTIADLVHDAGALLFVDGVHLTAHVPVDVAAFGADVFVCSPYKFFGPHCGVLAARVELLEQMHPDKLLPATDAVPERFELGTLPYESMAGTSAAVDFIASLGDGTTRRERITTAMHDVDEHEDGLRVRIEDGLAELSGVTVYSRAKSRTPTLWFTIDGHDPAHAYRFLAERGVNAPAGTFYAYEPARRLGVDSGVRVGLAPYNNDEDVDRLLTALGEFTATS